MTNKLFLYGGIAFTVLLLIGIGIITFFFVTQSIFTPTEKLITQYVVNDADLSLLNQQLSGSSFTYSDSFTSKEVSINTGKNIFKFVAFKTDKASATGFGDSSQSGYSSYGSTCYEKMDVYKNGNKITTLKSWGNDNDMYDTIKDNWSKPQYVYDDDIKKDSYIEVKLAVNSYATLQYPFSEPCAYVYNTFKIKIAEESILFNASIPTEFIDTLPVTLSLDNKLSTSVKGNLVVDVSVPTGIGSFDKQFTQEITLNSGKQDIVIDVPVSGELEEIKIKPSFLVKFAGTNFENLNFPDSNVVVQLCYNTRGDGSCEQSRPVQNGARAKINPTDYIEIGTLKGDEIILKNKEIIISPPTQNLSTNGTLIVEPPIEPPTTTEKPNYFLWIGLSLIIIMIIAIIILAIIIINKKK